MCHLIDYFLVFLREIGDIERIYWQRFSIVLLLLHADTIENHTLHEEEGGQDSSVKISPQKKD